MGSVLHRVMQNKTRPLSKGWVLPFLSKCKHEHKKGKINNTFQFYYCEFMAVYMCRHIFGFVSVLCIPFKCVIRQFHGHIVAHCCMVTSAKKIILFFFATHYKIKYIINTRFLLNQITHGQSHGKIITCLAYKYQYFKI